MGASKKLMEELIMAYSGKLKITTARFANVAFSNGSLPQGFIERIAKRQPWSVPPGHQAFLRLTAGVGRALPGSLRPRRVGDIIFPKLDEQRDMISFDTIALDFLKYMGLEADICCTEEEARQKALLLNEYSTSYPVYFFDTDTSGEKPYEEFFTSSETIDYHRFINLGVIKNSARREIEYMDKVFERLRHLLDLGSISKGQIVEILKTWLPDFEHIGGKGKGLE